MSDFRPITAIALRMSEQDQPVLVLQDDLEREIHITIGLCEAKAINMIIDGEQFPRPLTHDLFVAIMEHLDVTLARVVIDDLSKGTFYSRLLLQGPDGPLILDCRPSDAIALALRIRAPILVSEEVMQGGEGEGEGNAE